ncbi:MAG TPA: carboxypeptidase-like regulatory domain-containing protein, partial [Hanamia sp.]|nr:carboxypeptidase-like regulatory domain-containing protein [Hanamia sp.]
MRKIFKCFTFLLLASSFSLVAFAQSNTIKGKIINSSTSEVVPAVSVTVRGSGAGTYTDDKGEFSLNINQPLPVTLVISSIGYEMQEVPVATSDFITVSLTPSSILGQEVVVSATRTPSRILESPVTIERIS